MSLHELTDYNQALEWIDTLPRTPGEIFKGPAGLERARTFFKLLGNPQEKHRTVHIAGTSGKGTTAMMMAQILAEHGLKVGLTLSPHVYDVRERCQINNALVPEADYLETLRSVLMNVNLMDMHSQPVTYYEVLLGAALKYFADQTLDYVILETGLGGTLDATNTIARGDKLPVITKIGLDHTHILGETVEQIAEQKAGIIQPGNTAFALKQSEAANTVIANRAAKAEANVRWVESGKQIEGLSKELSEINRQLVGDFQKENVSIAVCAVSYLAQRDGWSYKPEKLEAALSSLKLPGRFEIIKNGDKTVVLDGAHNQQKLEGLVSSLKTAYPNQKFGVLFANADKRNSLQLAKLLKPIAKQLIVSEYNSQKSDMAQRAHKFTEAEINELNAQPMSLEAAAEHIKVSADTHWLVTGSFLMLGDVKSKLK